VSKRVKTLKKRLFQRDGWRGPNPETGHNTLWYAWCAFGCGTLLTRRTATIDHYPLPRRLGGHRTLENTRLACLPCNSREAGNGGLVVPEGLTPFQRRQWWRRQHGLPPNPYPVANPPD
jgi:hypothetical protein